MYEVGWDELRLYGNGNRTYHLTKGSRHLVEQSVIQAAWRRLTANPLMYSQMYHIVMHRQPEMRLPSGHESACKKPAAMSGQGFCGATDTKPQQWPRFEPQYRRWKASMDMHAVYPNPHSYRKLSQLSPYLDTVRISIMSKGENVPLWLCPPKEYRCQTLEWRPYMARFKLKQPEPPTSIRHTCCSNDPSQLSTDPKPVVNNMTSSLPTETSLPPKDHLARTSKAFERTTMYIYVLYALLSYCGVL